MIKAILHYLKSITHQNVTPAHRSQTTLWTFCELRRLLVLPDFIEPENRTSSSPDLNALSHLGALQLVYRPKIRDVEHLKKF